jgi:hypothetical protein
MFVVVCIALLMLVGGSTFLRELLNPREHPGWFILFWFGCAWLTLTALFLALFDVLIVRGESRAARKILRERIARDAPPDR